MREDLDPEDQYWEYQVDYWTHPKRCALWRVDAESLAVEHVTDLPSRGDTCFPEILPLSDRRYLVFNYTSPLDGPDITWQEGQMGKTSIYYSVLSMPAPVSEE